MVSHEQKQQKTCFLGTVWPGHVGLNKDECSDEEFMSHAEDWWTNLDIPNTQYAYAQFEIGGKQGGLHLQIALKVSSVTRATTLMNRFSGHWEPAANPNAVYNYCEKTEGRIKALEPKGSKPTTGSKRTEGHGSLKAVALELLKEGACPAEIAQRAPEVYFQHHRAIDRLWERMQEPVLPRETKYRGDDVPLDGEAEGDHKAQDEGTADVH